MDDTTRLIAATLVALLVAVGLFRIILAKYWWMAWVYAAFALGVLAIYRLVVFVFAVFFRGKDVGGAGMEFVVLGIMALVALFVSFLLGRRRQRHLCREYGVTFVSERPIDEKDAVEMKTLADLQRPIRKNDEDV